MNLSGLVAFVFLIAVVSSAEEIDTKLLQCQVCRSTMTEIGDELSKIDPKINLEIGNGRLDHNGNLITKTVPLARSEIHISEILDKICETMSDYVRATYKSNGNLMIMKLMSPEGGMNPKMSDVDIIQDGDLNKSLQFLCEEIVEEHEDPIIKAFREGKSDIIEEVCTRATNICDESMPIDEEDEQDDSIDRTEL